MRLRDFCAGPASTTRHFFLFSEFIERYGIAAFESGLSPPDGAQFRGGRNFLRDAVAIKILLDCLDGKIGRPPPLLPGGSIHPPSNYRRKFNRIESLGHGHFSLSLKQRKSRRRSSPKLPFDAPLSRYFATSSNHSGIHTPPFITNFTRSVSVMSSSGLPETATRSAYLPFSTYPICLPRS